MWKKSVSLGLIILGVTVVFVNIYGFNKGISAESKAIIEVNDFQQQKEDPSIVGVSKGSLSAEETLYENLPANGELIGELTIPKLNRSLPIFEGTTEDVLKKGVGHYAGSVLPGENNNSILSGHRDTVFRDLREVGVNDTLIVSTDAGEFLYKVRKVRIVDKDDRTVIVPKPQSTLTVTTCYPFGFIGPAPQRYVLVSDLISQIE
ncbi:class D sortase [Bacillus solitudinis]|uniref:class D sortase n=1 Tax=Bacillus solitudinis TaxID=2014074 RepID=UPI000C23313F|nr:class D sortase [Bacillus solitudinis]